MVTALYASLLTLILIWLSYNVIKQRRAAQISYSDGGVEALQIARSAQGNAVDYIPITLILMALTELNGTPLFWVHIMGILFVLGRIFHAKAILNRTMKGRVIGMQFTLFTMLGLVASNLLYLPYENFF
ncbi:MAPEG family protein [Vibrio sp. ZSDZ34]|uniref:MAPEG family protein n=1 Tax=Vibrio gelatinilyticus TaxID=2893468 RepID=A0A9X1WAG9_9VIBR|nr:MAPEG family protein [Vibrio gelatinilyticus]MCJ2376983.1 MAPEG family protein [Vibrio gelatinilyticus]